MVRQNIKNKGKKDGKKHDSSSMGHEDGSPGEVEGEGVEKVGWCEK